MNSENAMRKSPDVIASAGMRTHLPHVPAREVELLAAVADDKAAVLRGVEGTQSESVASPTPRVAPQHHAKQWPRTWTLTKPSGSPVVGPCLPAWWPARAGVAGVTFSSLLGAACDVLVRCCCARKKLRTGCASAASASRSREARRERRILGVAHDQSALGKTGRGAQVGSPSAERSQVLRKSLVVLSHTALVGAREGAMALPSVSQSEVESSQAPRWCAEPRDASR